MESKPLKLSRLAGYSVASVAVLLVGFAVNRFLPGSILGLLQDIGLISLIACAAVYVFLGLRWLKRRMFWKVRNRIIVSFAFVGIFPLIILMLMTAVTLGIIFKRLSGFYLEHEMRGLAQTLEQAGTTTALAYLREAPVPVSDFRPVLESGLEALPPGLRRVGVGAYRPYSPEGKWQAIASVTSYGAPVPIPADLPSWARPGFSELTTDGNGLFFTVVTDVNTELRLVLMLPLDEEALDFLRRRTATDLAVTPANPRTGGDEFQRIYSALGESQEGITVNWAHFVQPIMWPSGETGETWSIILSVPVRILLDHFFARDSGPLMVVALGLGVAFVLVELVSLFIGIRIAGGITRSIHGIYAAVENIRNGNFAFRIPVRGRDQLADMAESFNEMSNSVVTLMGQMSQREALEKELEIAKEVQNQLFPQKLPFIRSLEIAAGCFPARQVSGDYYDFLSHTPSRLDIVVGDISGKGISAALLMASLQSTIRSGLSELDNTQDPRRRIASVVKSVNRQLYRRSSPESYSTLVVNHFDADQMKLFYCNAGHHPPLLFSGGEVSGLTVGGTVVGLFENWDFEAGEVSLRPGDLVLYFTDGVVEAENRKGDQFTTERLVDLVRTNTFLTSEDIQSLVVDQVFEWSESTEQSDDITVLCMKVV